MAETTNRFDLIVLDPPPLARSRGDAERAGRLYVELNTVAMRALAPGGRLMTFSCSTHFRADDFVRAVRFAASNAGRNSSPACASRPRPRPSGAARSRRGRVPDRPVAGRSVILWPRFFARNLRLAKLAGLLEYRAKFFDGIGRMERKLRAYSLIKTLFVAVALATAACHREVAVPPLPLRNITLTDKFFDVWPTSPTRAFIVGDRGKVLLTEDGGRTLQAYRYRHPARRIRNPDDRRSERLPVRAGRPHHAHARRRQDLEAARLADASVSFLACRFPIRITASLSATARWC